MSLSALCLAAIGLSLTFAPDEISIYLGISSAKTFQLILQILGALYFAFAMLNWMAKGSLIGGIYNKPIALANFAHFSIGGLALLKELLNNSNLPILLWIIAGIYFIFASIFGLILSRHPIKSLE